MAFSKSQIENIAKLDCILTPAFLAKIVWKKSHVLLKF